MLEDISEAALSKTLFGGHFGLVVFTSFLSSSMDSDKTYNIYITIANIFSTQTFFSNQLVRKYFPNALAFLLY